MNSRREWVTIYAWIWEYYVCVCVYLETTKTCKVLKDVWTDLHANL